MTHPYMRPDVRLFLDRYNAMGAPPIEQILGAGRRDLLVASGPSSDLDVGDLAVIRDVTGEGPHGPVRARLFDARPDRLPGPVMVFFHGGGFAVGDLDTHAALCADLARGLDLPVVSIDYRLAPEHPYPAAPDDAEAGARWVAGAPDALGLNITSLVLAGDSAGGNLAIVVAMALRDDPAAVPVIAQFPMYPALGRAHEYPSFDAYSEGHLLTRDSMRFFDRAYAPDPDHWRGRPADGRFEGLPPALVVTASLDPLLDEGRAYVGKLAAAGVAVTYREAVGTIHGFMTFRRVIPSAVGDLAGCIAVLKPMIAEAEANRVMAGAAG